MIELTPFRKIIQPKLKSLEPNSNFGTFYTILAESLNEWFDKRIIIQLGIIDGIIITPAGIEIPFTGSYLKPEAESLNIDPIILQSYATTKKEVFPNIFNYIGSCINKTLRVWTSNSIAWTKFLELKNISEYITPIKIITTLESGIITTHFYKYGKDFINRMQDEPPEDINTFNLFWDEFEYYLKGAITASPIATGIASGPCPPGNFEGIATIKLSADPGDINE